MTHSAIDINRLAGQNTNQAARLLADIRTAALTGRRAAVAPRPDIGASWHRVQRDGVDPERDAYNELLPLGETEERRQGSPLRTVLPLLRRELIPVADAAQHIMLVCDAEGRILWREGNPAVMRKANKICLEPGSDWGEGSVGTNGVGTPLVARRPVQVFSAEHFVEAYHAWTCAGAPITDPRDGRLLGVVDLSGPLETMHPATLMLVGSVARLAEAELRTLHSVSLDRLRSVAAPLLARIGGRAVAVDTNGWVAAVTGMPPLDRLPLPRSFGAGQAWLASLGSCSVEPLPGGWLLRVPDSRAPAPAEPTRIVLDLSGARRWTVTVCGEVGTWTHELSPRHAELLYLLARHRTGRSAAELSMDVFGDPGRTVTVRAELSRVRRYLGGVLDHRPYRFHEAAEIEVLLPEDSRELLPHSLAPAITGIRGR